MKNPMISRNSFGFIFACLNLAAVVSHAEAGERHSFAAPLAALLPRQILVGPQIGMTGSSFTGSAQYQALIMPTEAMDRSRLTPSWGAVVSARWSHWFSLTLSPRRETHRLKTREETVSFPDNPFPHTLKSSTELAYNVWPISLGMGLFGKRQHFQVQIGAYSAFLDHAEINWTVDGEPYGNRPSVEYRSSQIGWFVGTEYGLRIGPGELLVGMDTQRGRHSLLRGMDGSLKARSTRGHLAYAWAVMLR